MYRINERFSVEFGIQAFNVFNHTQLGDPNQLNLSYELGTWHIIVLNSECTDVGGCEAGSPEEKWLRADLAAHPVACTLAYWHKPLFSSG